jgi:hypothetical protein
MVVVEKLVNGFEQNPLALLAHIHRERLVAALIAALNVFAQRGEWSFNSV